jgi:hypothetical protein
MENCQQIINFTQHDGTVRLISYVVCQTSRQRNDEFTTLTSAITRSLLISRENPSVKYVFLTATYYTY